MVEREHNLGTPRVNERVMCKNTMVRCTGKMENGIIRGVIVQEQKAVQMDFLKLCSPHIKTSWNRHDLLQTSQTQFSQTQEGEARRGGKPPREGTWKSK